MRHLSLALCVSVCFTLGIISSVQGQQEWRRRDMESLNFLLAADYAAGMTVAVGNLNGLGWVHTTEDVRSRVWTEVSYPSALNVTPVAVAHWQDQWVILDTNGSGYMTNDFENWESIFVGMFDLIQLRKIEGKLYTTGRNGFASSADGETWETVVVVDGVYTEFRDIIYGAERYVLVGRSEGQGVLYGSADGVEWTAQYLPTDAIDMLYSVDFAQDQFVGVGNNGIVMTSPDGVTWDFPETEDITGTLLNVRYVNERWIAGASGGRIFSSKDGATWVQDIVPIDGTRWGNISATIEAEGLSVAVGQNGQVLTLGEDPVAPVFTELPQLPRVVPGTVLDILARATGYPSNIEFTWIVDGVEEEVTTGPGTNPIKFSRVQIPITAESQELEIVASNAGGDTSSEAIPLTLAEPGPWDEWTVLLGVSEVTPRSSAYGNGRFVVGMFDGTVLTSEDGVTWESHSVGEIGRIESMAFINEAFVLGSSNGYVSTSDNGADWSEPLHVINSGNEFSRDIASIVWFDGHYFAGSNSSLRLFRSADLLEWEEIEGVLAGRLFVHDGALHTVGSNTTWQTTVDGETWTDSPLVRPSAGSIMGVAHGNGVFVVSGGLQEFQWLAISEDGVEWDLTTSPFPASALRFVEGVFLANGQGLWSSPDGREWTQHALAGANQANEVIFGEGQRVLANANGDWLVGGEDVVDPEPGSGYTMWIEASGLAGERAAPDFAPFRDGLPNLVRYALGFAPTEQIQEASTIRIERKMDGAMTISFPRRSEATDVEIVAQHSVDLTDWEDVSLDGSEFETEGEGIQRIVLPVNDGEEGSFFRLEVRLVAADPM